MTFELYDGVIAIYNARRQQVANNTERKQLQFWWKAEWNGEKKTEMIAEQRKLLKWSEQVKIQLRVGKLCQVKENETTAAN